MTTALSTRALTVRLASGDAAPAGREIPVIASTTTIDSYDEVIDQASWRLDRFVKAPTALLQHREYEDPIGYYRDVRVDGDALRATLVLYEGAADPGGEAEKVLARYRQGGPVSVSVGFHVGRSETEDRGGRKIRTLYDCELHEISVVSIGANPDAVATRAARRRKDTTTMQSVLEFLASKGVTPADIAAACGLEESAVAAMLEPKMEETKAEDPAPAVEEAKSLRSSIDKLSAEVAASNARAKAAEQRAEKMERTAEVDAMKAARQWSPALDPFLSTLSLAQLRAFRATAPALVPAGEITPPSAAPDADGSLPANIAALVAKGWKALTAPEKHTVTKHSEKLAARLRASA